jgi:uncharacterized protein
MTLQDLQHDNQHVLLRCISGSQAYGLALPHSDTDIKGVFVLPKVEYYGLQYIDQLNNDTNDMMYYEIKKFIDLLLKNNPNIIELLSTPNDCVLHKHPVMDLIQPEMFLSKLCNQTFGQYAFAQIKKAKGLNKKIVNPIAKDRKTVLDFCYMVQGQGSVPAKQWLAEKNVMHEHCGLVKIDHMRDMYALFQKSQTNEPVKFRGIFSGETADDVLLSSVPKGLEPLAILCFNKDGYSIYCKDYKAYWAWVNERNEERYANTVNHGKNYDSKNMMHVFRLLNMAEEIARFKQVNVRRTDREELLKIRAGEFLYEDLVKRAEDKMARINELFIASDLPDAPDWENAQNILIGMRQVVYG